MLNILSISIGAFLAVISIVVLIISIIRTPTNLRGFYGTMFSVLAVIGLLGGAGLVVFGIMA